MSDRSVGFAQNFNFKDSPPPQYGQLLSMVGNIKGVFDQTLQGQLSVSKGRQKMKCYLEDFADYEVPCEQYRLKIILPKTKGCDFKWYVVVRNRYYITNPRTANTTNICLVVFALVPSRDGTQSYFLITPTLLPEQDEQELDQIYNYAVKKLPGGESPVVPFTTKVKWNTAHSSWSNGQTFQVYQYTQITFIVTDGAIHTVTSTGVNGIGGFNITIPAGSSTAIPYQAYRMFDIVGVYVVTDSYSGNVLNVRVVGGCCNKNACNTDPASISSLTTGYCPQGCN